MAVARRLSKLLVVLAALWVTVPVAAAELVLRVQHAALPGASAEDIELIVGWPEDRAPQGLALRVGRVVVDAAELELRAVDYSCVLSLIPDSGFGCKGRLSLRDSSGSVHAGSLHLQQQGDAVQAALSVAGADLTLRWPLVDDAAVSINIAGVPATWLQQALADMWPGAHMTDGTLEGRFELTWDTQGAMAVDGRINVRALGLDTDDGSIAAAGLNAAGTLGIRLGEHLQVRTDIEFAGGELLFDRFYAELPPRSLRLALIAREQPEGRWRVDSVDLADDGVFRLRGTVMIDPTAESPLQTADLDIKVGRADEVVARYADGLLGLAGLAGLRAEGALDARVQMDTRGVRAIEVDVHDLYVLDAGGRFSLEALSGSLSFGPDAALQESELRWAGASFYRIGFGALRLPLRSGAGGMDLISTASVAVLGGQVALQRLHWRQGEAQQVDFEASLEVETLDLARLAAALEWPAFGGQLSGRIPAVRYDDGILSFDGGLEVDVFEGRVSIDRLSMERPFGVLPTLNADIRFNGLDLQQMTRVFDFGEIQGRLQGHMLGLRLIDWEPVAFDAVLRTEKGGGSRRISQRAVESLSSVGGGGGVAALQSSVLRVFSNFSYDEIGLSCRLINHVCHMDGVDSVGQGYAIVKGSGLPRISVVGHQRQVDWPVLLARLKAATSGAGPIMN